MKLTVRKIVLITSLLTVGSACFAAPSGIYIAGGLGWAQQVDVPSQLTLMPFGATQQDEGEFANRFSVGYNYLTTANLGIGAELGYGNYGGTNYGIGSLNSNAWDMLLVGTWSVSPKYDLIAKGGIARETLQIPDSLTMVMGDNRTEYNPMIAVGVGYNFTPSTQIHLDYGRIFGEQVNLANNSATPSINSLMLGLKHTF